MLHATTRRWAAAGAAAALAGAALVGATSTPASAGAPGTSASALYTCTVSGNPVPIQFGFDVAGLTLPGLAGQPVAAGSPIVVEATVPAPLVPTLDGLGIDDISSDNMVLPLGASAVPVNNLHVTNEVDNEDGSRTYTAEGVNGAFKTPAAGTPDYTTPTGFNLQTFSGGTLVTTVPCTATMGTADFAPSTFAKQSSTTTASLAKAQINKGDKAKVIAKVKRQFGTATGKVKVFKGTTEIGAGSLNSGKATITTKPFKQTGKYTLTVKYLGNGFATGSQDKVTLKVVR